MITITGTINALERFFEAMAKARVNSALLAMGRERVEQLGYSFEALQTGPSAWPWRKTTQDSAEENEIKVHMWELESFSGREFHDPGMARSGIDKDAA